MTRRSTQKYYQQRTTAVATINIRYSKKSSTKQQKKTQIDIHIPRVQAWENGKPVSRKTSPIMRNLRGNQNGCHHHQQA
eukprot:2201101-Ditylum_brightwellii.AAC.1